MKEELIKIYSKNSKHSNYQILSTRLQQIINNKDLEFKSRFEFERLDYVFKKNNLQNKYILDIGGNTGFFTFEALNNGAKKVHYYEGNKEHANFVKLAAKALGLRDSVRVTNSYYQFEKFNETYDVIFLFNVLHHIGDDYGKSSSINDAKKDIIKQLNSLSKNTKLIVFQMGFNWQGNKKKPLFKNGTKVEMINFIEDGIKDYWGIVSIGIAVKTNDQGVKYFDLNNNNIARDDKLGEFLNRPIFILKSKY